ncbi:MAG: gliding motility protein GldL, partial [Porphyromonadaceae bacterium]|nr:gliding motility protein GldL [Porphyromonadaceae bacterium]
MGKYKNYKNSIEKFLSGDSGKRFFNFAYSIGAAIVIWGALFKILHLPGGNVMLSIGMGVEVLMFILTAFDRPSREYHWEEVFPVFDSKNPEDRPEFNGGGGVTVGGTVILGGGSGNGSGTGEGVTTGTVTGAEARRIAGIPSNIDVSEEDTKNLSNSIQKLSAAAEQISRMAEMTDATQKYL